MGDQAEFDALEFKVGALAEFFKTFRAPFFQLVHEYNLRPKDIAIFQPDVATAVDMTNKLCVQLGNGASCLRSTLGSRAVCLPCLISLNTVATNGAPGRHGHLFGAPNAIGLANGVGSDQSVGCDDAGEQFAGLATWPVGRRQ